MPDPPHELPAPQNPDPVPPLSQQSLLQGVLERKELTEKDPDRHRHYDWIMRFVMKPFLFVFVLGLNVWWDVNVLHIVWQAGRANAGFHLGDPVLIALITTSIANFLVLIHIVTKHLFPDQKRSSI